MRIAMLSLMVIFASACNNPSGQPGTDEGKDTTIKPETIQDVRNQKPVLKDYHELSFNIGDTSRHLRILLNNDTWVKCWMVYHDRVLQQWNTLSWTGKGDSNKLLVDTVFNQWVGINDSFSDPPTFYMAISRDDGKTWESSDMSLVSLTCPGDLPRHRAKFAQLIISNDFFQESGLPSLTMAWQWNHLVTRRSNGIVPDEQQIQKLCTGLKEIKIVR